MCAFQTLATSPNQPLSLVLPQAFMAAPARTTGRVVKVALQKIGQSSRCNQSRDLRSLL